MFITGQRRVFASLRAAVLLGAFIAAVGSSSSVQAQKKLAWEFTGSVSASLISAPDVIPDVYSFEAVAGDSYVFNTTVTDLDTTIRVVSVDAAVEIFNDDRNPSDLTSHVDFTASVGGTYIVIVSTFAGTPASGAYFLNFEHRHCDEVPDACVKAAPREKPAKPDHP